MAWCVYTLVDPLTETVFYVGVSINPWQRLQNHISDTASSAWPRCREIKNAGARAQLHVVAECTDKIDAMWIERALIVAHPELVNSKAPSLSERAYPMRGYPLGVAGDITFFMDEPN